MLFSLDISSFIHIGLLEKTFVVYILLLGSIILGFSYKYLSSQKSRNQILLKLFGLMLSTILMVVADHVLFFVSALLISNLLLINLMAHKKSWQAAKSSAELAYRHLLGGVACIFLGLIFVTHPWHIFSIRALPLENIEWAYKTTGLIFILIGALIQSAIWPFHRWLLSSMNAPTPVSAMMHAGLINGGGLILIKFSGLFSQEPMVLLVVFYIGLLTAILGTAAKWIQVDIKSMLACSTMAQMGFMFLQCGLGLFSAAAAHICLHGLFKAHMFLGHAQIGLSSTKSTQESVTFKMIVVSILSGLLGGSLFAYIKYDAHFILDTRIVLCLVAMLFCIQVALAHLKASHGKSLWVTFTITSGISVMYAYTIELFESVILPSQLMMPQNFTVGYIAGASLLGILWLLFMSARHLQNKLQLDYSKAYVYLLNFAQPHALCVTTHRNAYEYK